MNYKQAEQRLKELLSTGFMVSVGFDYDTSLEVEKLFHRLYESDKTLFKVEEVFEEGLFFEEDGTNYFGLSAGAWEYFGINAEGKTEITDYTDVPVINESELREIVEALASEGVEENKFEAVSGDQSLFDLVGATDEHFYIVRNAKHTGIYATGFTVAKERILAERKLKEPEFIPYRTENYPHEDYEGKAYAFRARNGKTAINFIDGDYSGEVVLTPENTIKFANELIAISNGVERKD